MEKKTFFLIIICISLLYSCRSDSTSEDQLDETVILGIFGGMGPEATADLYQNIVRLTPAEKDQDHIPTLIYSLPQVPDRMNAIFNSDSSIIPYLIDGVTRLENAGATYIAIPCNTVHYFYELMSSAVDIPIIHMIRETVIELKQEYPDVKNIGLLATTGTLSSGLYNNELEENAYRVIIPDDEIENEYVMKAVFGIKSGVDQKINEDLLAIAAQNLIDKGAELIILGCTEIPLAFNPDRSGVPVINATEVLARRAIDKYIDHKKTIKE